MTTKIAKPIRREVTINGVAHTVVISDAGVVLTVKGRRNGAFVAWKNLSMSLATLTRNENTVASVNVDAA